MRREVETDFAKDTASHQMTILHDSGTYRHIRFQHPRNSIYWFELVTWPGCLTIHGDMGTWTFSRTPDMFDLFRSRRSVELSINPGYWAEKLRHGTGGSSERSAKVFSEENLREHVKSYMENWSEEELPPATRARIMDRLELEVFAHGDSEHEALAALFEFEHKGPRNFRFNPFDGLFGFDWSYQYLWCCWAIVWGIRKYDETRKESA